jgi:hypothetical protein
MQEAELKAIWERVLELWRWPRLPDPQFYDDPEKAPNFAKGAIECIDLKTKILYAILPAIEKHVGIDCLEAIVAHGVGHHTSCPYDIITGIKMDFAAGKALGDDFLLGRRVAYYFSEWVVNTDLYRSQKPVSNMIVTALKRQAEKNSDDLTTAFHSRMHELLFRVPPGTIISQKYVNESAEKDAKTVARLIGDDLFSGSTWTDKLHRTAPIIAKYLREDPHLNWITPVCKKSAIEDALAAVAPHISKNEMDVFRKLAASYGIGEPKQADMLFYRGHAQKYAVQLPMVRSQSGELFKHTPTAWEPSDAVDRLDVPYSLQQHGELICGMTTKQWQYDQNKTFNDAMGRPDVIIITDTSGSMPDPSSKISWPVVGSLVVAYSALKAGSRVAAINFSNQCVELEPCTSQNLIEDILLMYQSGGTVSPTESLLSMAKKMGKSAHIYYSSDTCLANPEEAVPALIEALKIAGGGGTIFLAGKSTDVSDALRKGGYNVHRLTNDADLVKISAATAEEVYR